MPLLDAAALLTMPLHLRHAQMMFSHAILLDFMPCLLILMPPRQYTSREQPPIFDTALVDD